MARQSPTHYITPSALSIIPNANELASDIAVFLQANTTIRVYSPRAGLGMVGQEYRSWPITGRNRRLSDATKPYTIYARLPKADGGKAYVTFAPKVWSEAEQRWLDKYAYITTDGLATGTAPDVTDENNWYAKLGDVSLPEGEAGEEQRTVTLDTGILGTAEYNTEWNVSPDALPLRLSLECRIDGVTPKNAGPTPYVYWNQVATLAATLTEGWTGTEIQDFDHWVIARDTDNETADAEWNAVHNGATNPNGFWTSGVINLQHRRGTGEIDDFDGTVSAVFIVNAMRLNPDWTEGSSEPQYIVLKSASINIMAETIERFEVAPTTAVMSFNPMTGAYTPSNGILLRIRAISQKGDASQLSNGQYASAGLTCRYAPEGSSTWTEIASPGPSARTWGATVPVSAFSDGKSVNVRIMRDNTELHRATIAYVRDGEDSKEREWIFLRSAEAITFGTQDHPYPATIAQGQVNPTGAASGTDENKDQDGWVPNGWWDNPQGSTEEYPYEYGAYRDHDTNDWGAFSAPSIWTHYGKDGKPGENAVRLDLDNAYDSIQYQGDGVTKVSPSGTVQTTASLFDGADDKSGDAVFVISNRSGMSDQQATISGRTVTVNGLISDGEVTVRAEYPVNSGKYYYAKFTVKKLIGTDKYDLVVAPNAVPINTSTTVADTPIGVQVYRTPANGGTRHLVEFTNRTTNVYGLTLSVKDSLNNDLAETTGTGTVTTRTFNLTGATAVNADNVAVILTKDGKTQDSETVPITHVHNGIDGTGANAVRLDLDNEMDVLPADADGNTLQEIKLATTVRLFDGSTAVSLDTSDVVSVGPLVIGGQPYGAVKSGTGGVTVTWTVPSGVTVDIDKAVLTIVVVKDSKQYTAKFVVAALKSGQPGVSPTVFQLLPSPAMISFKRDSSGDIPSSTQALSLSVKKSDGDGASVISVESSGLNVRYRTDRAPSSASDGDVWPSAGLSVNSSVTYPSIYIAAFDSNGVLVDRDTVAIVKDGTSGGNTATVMLYKRSATPVTSVGISATLYYKFATKKLYTDAACTTEATTQLNGWNLSIPSGADPIYATSAVAYSTEDHDSIGSTEWVTPVQFTDNGENGISTAVVLLYKRSATTISAHGITATLHYKFADGNLYTKSGSTYTEATAAVLNNWSRDIPASDGNPCYAIQAAALGTGDYDPIATADWSGARVIVEDGIDGQDMRENLIDHSRPSYEVDLSDESQRWQTYTDNDLRYITDKVFDPAVIPDDTPLSGQMRLTLSGCTYASGATVGIYMSGANRWPFIARLAPVSADGTYTIKMENFTIASGHGEWDGKVYLQVKGCGTSGTVSVSRVKLEVGEKCSDWCLSENDKTGEQGPQGAAGGPSKVYRRLIAGCIYFCASDGATERAGVLNSQDYIAVRAKEGDGYESGWIMYRCTESFVATAAAIANLNEAIEDYEGGETTKSQIDAAMAASSLTPQPSGIPSGKGAFAEIATNQTAAFFTQLVAKNANIEVLTGAQYYIVDENNATAGGFGKVEDENDGKTYMIWAGGEAPSAAPFAVDAAGNVKMETGVFGGFLKNTARVITAENVKDYVSWGLTEDWYLDSSTNTYKQRKAWILDLDKAGSNVIFFSGSGPQGTGESYDSIKLELQRMRDEGRVSYTDGVDYSDEIYIPLPWYANQVALSIGGETGNADWISYAARLGHSTLVDDWAYTQPNVALQYIDSHYRVVNATSDNYDQWWKIHFAGLARLGDMGWGVGLPSFISGEACEWILLCNAGSRGTGSDEAFGVWWTTVMSYGSQAAGGAHLFSAAWMYVYGLIPL